ncbi:hypothetical protein BOTBODRAFT_173577 [Botryobasidium botryosum FD-172 SS1]|uniref:Uncharacterized protein n=1 Tax=Botryobasidium botryosum (strain FD-172 SS1) TaxID=930990 RepID=A0A067MJH7_BOTB1|nr:hypothetical protein BOTBODRAFT_173577 [Botryobasidium botryosum FD-172 SS1]
MATRRLSAAPHFLTDLLDSSCHLPQLDFVKALGLGIHLSKLNQFESSYKTASTNFASLLQYPFLQSILISEATKSAAGRTSSDLRSIIIDGSSRFDQLTQSDISITQQVVTFSKTAPMLLKSLTVAGYASGVKPLVEQYAAESAASGSENEAFFDEYSQNLDDQISLMTTKIADLIAKITNAETELTNANVGKVIADTIKARFMYAHCFQIWRIKALFSTLSDALSGILKNFESLLLTWTDIAPRLKTVESADRKVSDTELNQVVRTWDKARNAATDYVDAVSGSGSTAPPSSRSRFVAATATAEDYLPKCPKTKGELMIASLIVNFVQEASSPQDSVKANANISDAGKEKILKAASPPAQTQDTLDEVSLQTSGVLKQFTCNNPDKPTEKINLQVMVTNCQKMYFDLQQKTVPLAQDLQTYSRTQLALLPKLVASNNVKPGELGVDAYLKANKTLQEDYKTQADEIFKDSLAYKQKWDNAINAKIADSLTSIAQGLNNITSWNLTRCAPHL